MDRSLHIILSFSAAGTMKEHLKEINSNDKIAVWNAPFTYGPLFKDFSDNELKRYAQYLNKLFGYYESDTNPYSTMHKIVNQNFGKYERVVVWHGDSVDELLLLYMICSLIKGRLFVADITELYELFPHFKSIIFPLALAHCSQDNIRIMYDKIKPISEEVKIEYSSRWDRWSKSDASLRLMGNDHMIFEANDDYFDSLILSKCSNVYIKVARIIGEVLACSNQLIGDSFLLNRVIWLIHQNKLLAYNNKEFRVEIEKSNRTNPNKRIINGINVTQMRFFSVKLN